MPGSWEFHVLRRGQQQRGARVRTYGSYFVTVNGDVQADLAGYVCEAPGPGENGTEGKNRLRVRQGVYGLRRHASARYATAGYAPDPHETAVHPMPALALSGQLLDRSDILIHPAHPWEPPTNQESPISDLFLSSIGCLNLTGPIKASQDMNFWESRGRVIALIASLRSYVGPGFEALSADRDDIPGAVVVIEGEPTDLMP